MAKAKMAMVNTKLRIGKTSSFLFCRTTDTEHFNRIQLLCSLFIALVRLFDSPGFKSAIQSATLGVLGRLILRHSRFGSPALPTGGKLPFDELMALRTAPIARRLFIGCFPLAEQFTRAQFVVVICYPELRTAFVDRNLA